MLKDQESRKAFQKIWLDLSHFQVMLTLFNSVVHHFLEYASPFWAPISSAGLQQVEQTQEHCLTVYMLKNS